MTTLSTPPVIRGLGDLEVLLNLLKNKDELAKVVTMLTNYIAEANTCYQGYTSIQDAKKAMESIKIKLDLDTKKAQEKLERTLTIANDKVVHADDALKKAVKTKEEAEVLKQEYLNKVVSLKSFDEELKATNVKLGKRHEELERISEKLDLRAKQLEERTAKLDSIVKQLKG